VWRLREFGAILRGKPSPTALDWEESTINILNRIQPLGVALAAAMFVPAGSGAIVPGVAERSRLDSMVE
jgi:hypothetical protein